MTWVRRVATLLLLVAAAGAVRAQSGYTWELPPFVDPPALPRGSRMTQELVDLGRHLFYDKRLSGNGTQSCSTCHVQALAFTDAHTRGIGSTGELHARSPMSLVNVAYRDSLTWANRNQQVLEVQALTPMIGEQPVELGLLGHEERVYGTLAADPLYRRLFAAAFPGEPVQVTRDNVASGIAAFERSIVSFNSPYDRYRFHREEGALSADAKRGMELFFSRKANCSACHVGQNASIDLGLNLDAASRTSRSRPDEPHFFLFRNTGLYRLGEPFSYPMDNLGLYEHTRDEQDIGKFRTPTLRNIALTAPYMHDGSIATLEEVLEHYSKGGRAPNSQQSPIMRPLDLNAQERSDLIAFLHSLTDPMVISDPRWSDPFRR